MDSKYIITPSGNFVNTDELYHWGIKGMKWGIRRYQNADGTLTDQGKKRYLNPDGTLNKKGKKKFGDSVKLLAKEKPKTSDDYLNEQISNMTDQELMQKVIRLRQEDSYKELSKKLGYDGPKSDIDYQIAELTKQKTYLGLQKDVRDLNNQLNPKKESSVKKIIKTAMDKAIIPAATEAGKDFLKKYLGEKAAKILAKEAKDTVDKVKDSTERVKEKEAKKEAKAEAKEAKKEAKAAEKASKVYDDSASGERNKKNTGGSGSSNNSSRVVVAEVIDNYSSRPASSISNSSSYNSSWTSRYYDTPVYGLPAPRISGYLPAPKDDD